MTPWTGAAAELATRVRAFIGASLSGASAEPFEALALGIHHYQVQHDPVLASLTERAPTRWQQIPAIPVGLFKDLPVGTVRPGQEGAAFMTSGTTGGGRGVHRLRSTALYDAGSLAWAQHTLPGLPAHSLNLLLDPALHPESSLSHMVALFASANSGRARWFLHDDGLRARAFIDATTSATGAVFVGATAFALAELLEDHDPAPLPQGSVLMVTGGFKGREHRLNDEGLYAAVRDRLAPTHLVTEYGMTELSSQLWGTPGANYRPPPWLRVLAVDPQSEAPLPPGQRGQLRFFDLCNLDGTLAIETLDAGVVHTDGSVELHGRLEGATPRGCSLTVEDVWNARGGR